MTSRNSNSNGINYRRIFHRCLGDRRPYRKNWTDTQQNPENDIDLFILKTGAVIRFHKEIECYYMNKKDIICISEKSRSQSDFYDSIFHELAHWTSHKSRLNRTASFSKQNESYWQEEIVAEFCSAFLCSKFRIRSKYRHIDYIGDILEDHPMNQARLEECYKKAIQATEYLLKL